MIFIVRHGETVFNVEDRFQGVADSPLTENGLAQAYRLADFFLGTRINVVVASPLARAQITAEILSAKLKLSCKTDDILREMCYGRWEGRLKKELIGTRLWERRIRNKFNFNHPGSFGGVVGGSYADLYKRFLPLFETFSLHNESENILYVSHTGFMRCVAKYFNKLSDAETADLPIRNDTVLCIDGGKLKSISLKI